MELFVLYIINLICLTAGRKDKCAHRDRPISQHAIHKIKAHDAHGSHYEIPRKSKAFSVLFVLMHETKRWIDGLCTTLAMEI